MFGRIPVPVVIGVGVILGITTVLGGLGLLGVFSDDLAAVCDLAEFTTTKFEDTNDGLCTEDDCSLREAVVSANRCPGPDVINVLSGTYVLTLSGTPAILNPQTT